MEIRGSEVGMGMKNVFVLKRLEGQFISNVKNFKQKYMIK